MMSPSRKDGAPLRPEKTNPPVETPPSPSSDAGRTDFLPFIWQKLDKLDERFADLSEKYGRLDEKLGSLKEGHQKLKESSMSFQNSRIPPLPSWINGKARQQ